MLIMLALVGAFITALVFIKATQIKKAIAAAPKGPPPSAVTTVVVRAQKWQPVLSAVGTLKAVNGVTLSTDLAGIVSEIAFESGTPVKKGDLLVTLDTKQEEAQLRSAEAKLALAMTDLERKRELIAKKAIAQSDWDSAQSQVSQMLADVEEMKALVARKRLTAPFDGMIGIRQVNLGQYINPGAPIAPLQSLDPIYVEFALPQQHIDAVAIGKTLRLGASGLQGERCEGTITAIDSQIDPSTRNVTIQGTVKNPAHKLRPGMFVDVEVLLPEQEGVLAIPASSIAYSPSGDSVYVVVPDEQSMTKKKVEVRRVTLGPSRGDQVSVTSGIKDGDEVVSSAVFKLRPGGAVMVNNEVMPGNDPKPKPSDS